MSEQKIENHINDVLAGDAKKLVKLRKNNIQRKTDT